MEKPPDNGNHRRRQVTLSEAGRNVGTLKKTSYLWVALLRGNREGGVNPQRNKRSGVQVIHHLN